MAIKGGSIIHVGNGTALIDRIQTGGPGQLNVPTEKIYELGNYKSVATVRDVPDLQFSLESYDVSPEVEALVTNSYAGREVTDAVTTAASPNITSSTAAFTPDDVGRMVIITFPDGSEHVSNITATTSATAATIADDVPAAGSALTMRIAENGIDLAKALPIDIASQFKAGQTATSPFAVINSVGVPFLMLEQMSYRFGLRDNATQSATLRGDSVFYNPGPTLVEETPGTNTAGQTVVTSEPAHQVDGGDERRVLSVTVGDQRLTFGKDYTESYGPVSSGAAVTTVTLVDPVPADKMIRIMYSTTAAVSYPQSVHPGVTVKPAAVKGKDIEIYYGGYDPADVAGSQANKIGSVQAVNADWRVTLEKDEEFGNAYAVAQDFEVPEVSGTVDVKPRDNANLTALIRRFTKVSDPQKVVAAHASGEDALDIVIKNPETGAVVKRIHIPDARFTVPGFQGRVQQKTTITFNFESDSGSLIVFER